MSDVDLAEKARLEAKVAIEVASGPLRCSVLLVGEGMSTRCAERALWVHPRYQPVCMEHKRMLCEVFKSQWRWI